MGKDAPKYVAEFIGTFMLVFTVGCNVLAGNPTWAVTSIAFCLMVSIYALGGVSGANFNPAVSLALGLTNKLPWDEVWMYMACQFSGGIIGGSMYAGLFGKIFNLAPSTGFGFFQCMLAETVYTFMLCFVVLNVAASKMHAGKNQFYGLAIAGCILAGGYGAGHISGGAFNPAVAWGIDISSIKLGIGWCLVYTIWEFIGAWAAARLFVVCRPEEADDHSEPPAEYPIGSRLCSEFLGTFILVLTVGLNVIGGSKAPVWSIAASLMSMIFALGTCSGAHFNPAVTISILCAGRNKVSMTDAGLYIFCQLFAGLMAGSLYAMMHSEFGDLHAETFELKAGAGFGWQHVAFAEISFTFLLCFVVLSVATIKSPLSQFFGLAIASCVTAGGYAIGAVSGGSLNPAVSIGIAGASTLTTTGILGKFWHFFPYACFEIIGGLLAAGVFRVVHAKEYDTDAEESEKA